MQFKNPFLKGYVDNEINARANTSELRAMWTQYIQQTPAASEEMYFWCDTWALMLSQQPGAQINDAAKTATTLVPYFVSKYAADTGYINRMPMDQQQAILGTLRDGGAIMDQLFAFNQRLAQPNGYAPQAVAQAYQGNVQQGLTMVNVVANQPAAWGQVQQPIQTTGVGSVVSPGNVDNTRVNTTLDYTSRIVTPVPIEESANPPLIEEVVEDIPLERVWTEATPYALVYNPDSQEIFYDIIDGVVHEEARAKMDWQKLEVRKFNNHYQPDEDGKAITTTWAALANNEIKTLDKTKEEVEILTTEIPFIGDAGAIYTGVSMAIARLRAREMIKDGLVWEFEYNQPVFIPTLTNMIGFMCENTKLKQLDMLADVLKEHWDAMVTVDGDTHLWGKEGFGKSGFAKLNRYITKLINEAIRKHLNLDVSIESFIHDWSELVGYLAKEYSHSLATLADERITIYVMNRLMPLTGTGLKTLLAESKDPQLADTLLPLKHCVYVASVKAYSHELQIEWDGNGVGVVKETVCPELHAALKALAKRALTMGNEKGNVYDIQLITGDDITLEITNAWLDQGSILISTVK